PLTIVVPVPPVVSPIAPVIGAEMVNGLNGLYWCTIRSWPLPLVSAPAPAIAVAVTALTFCVTRIPPLVIVLVPPARLTTYPFWLLLLNRRLLVVELAGMGVGV